MSTLHYENSYMKIGTFLPSDMPGIPRRLAEHSLNILKGFKPVKQALRRFSEPKRQAMGEELAKLLEAGYYQRHQTSRLASKPGDGTKEGQILAPMCRL